MTVELFLFTVDPVLAARATRAGVDGIVIDWERAGKERRQAGADTQINADTREDLERVRSVTEARIICRINAYGEATPAEVGAAVERGADELLLPMVRTRHEVERVLDLVRGRAGVGMLIETHDAASDPGRFTDLPLARVYVGLNDLAIERRSPTIFRALVDGTIDEIAATVRAPLGFAGLTDPSRGAPVPCRLLIDALARARASFTFLRRSFLRDLGDSDPARLVSLIRDATRRAEHSEPAPLDVSHEELRAAVDALEAVVHR